MRGFNKALQAMPATVALFMVLKPGWSTLPLAVWFYLPSPMKPLAYSRHPQRPIEWRYRLHSGGSPVEVF